MVTVKRDQTLFIPGLKPNSMSLMRVNKAASARAQPTFFRVNCFLITLSNQSCMGGLPSQASPERHVSIPTMWNDRLRQRVHEMQDLAVAVVIGEEAADLEFLNTMLVLAGPEEVTEFIQDQRDENMGIVVNAVDELCNVLEMSSKLRHMRVGLFNHGHLALRTGS